MPLKVSPIPRKGHKSHLWSNPKAQTSVWLEVQALPTENNAGEQVRWSPLPESLWSRNCDIKLVLLGRHFIWQVCCHQEGKVFQMEGSDPVRVIINHLGSKTFPTVKKRPQGWEKEGKEKIKGPLMVVIYCTTEPAKWNFSGVWNLPVSKVRDFQKGLFYPLFFSLGCLR